MNFRHIAIILPDLRCGGVEKMTVRLANHWIMEGRSVTIICLFDAGRLQSELLSRVDLLCLRSKSIKSSLIPLLQTLRRNKFDLVIARMWPLTVVAIIAWLITGRKSSLIVSEHTNLIESAYREMKIPPIWIWASMRLLYRFPDRIVAVSRGIAASVSRLSGIHPSRIDVIYNPAQQSVDLSSRKVSLSSLNARRICEFSKPGPVKSSPYKCLAVGSLKEQKAFDVLINAFSLVVSKIDARLFIAGDGPLHGDLHDLILRLGLQAQVILLGHVDNVASLYQEADLFILSSSWEGFGNVIVEALSFGLPVVSTDCLYGPFEILDGGKFGRLTPVGDCQRMAAAIIAELSGETSSFDARISRSNQFSVDMVADMYLDLKRRH